MLSRVSACGQGALPLPFSSFPFPGPPPTPPPAPRPSQGAGPARGSASSAGREGGRRGGSGERERERKRERLSQIFMPLQAAAAAGKTSPGASAPFTRLPPSPPAAPQSKCAGPRRASPGGAAPSRRPWPSARSAGLVRPARSGCRGPLPGLLPLLPAGPPPPGPAEGRCSR